MLPDGVLSVTTIVPYKVLEDGTMVNSFEYAADMPVNTRATVPMYDVSAELKGNYKAYTAAILNTFPAYQMYEGSFRWSKVNSSSKADVYYINMQACVAGQLYTNPSDGSEPVLKNSNYSNKSNPFVQGNPTASKWYYTSKAMTTSTGIVYCNDALNHGGWVYLSFKYHNASGTILTDDFSTWCFRK